MARRTRPIAAVAACVVVVPLLAIALASCGRSPSTTSTSVDETSSTESASGSTTSAVVTSSEPQPSDTGVSASTAAPAGTPTSVESSDLLVAALPRQGDLPEGWTLGAQQPKTGFQPASGPFIGSCSGGNADARALEHHAFGAASGAAYDAPRGAWGYVSIIGFPTVDDARGYVDLTRDLAECTQQFTVEEGASSGTYDGFADGALDGKQEWSVTETVTNSVPDVSGTDEALAVVLRDVLTSELDGTTYSAQLDDVSVLERYGRFVLVANLSSYCCDIGYRQPAGSEFVTLADLLPAMDAIRAHARSALAGR